MKEKLEEKLAALEAQKSQHMANYNACTGAIEVIKQIINEISVTESVNTEAAPTKEHTQEY